MKRTILLFPEFNNQQHINKIREKYDPLAFLIPPHITLVFPFESELSKVELENHLSQVLAAVPVFEIEFQGVSGDYRDGYLFLNCIKGNDQLISLHNKLYKGILAQHLYQEVPYFPHITLGRLDNDQDFSAALAEICTDKTLFSSTIEKVTVEIIGEDESSTIEIIHHLKV